jgi:transcriptional regulator with GAF, ATPase, and Fis domain
MALSMWVRFLGRVTAEIREGFGALLRRAGIDLRNPGGTVEGFGVVVFEQVDAAVLDGLRACANGATVLAIRISPVRPSSADVWALAQAGARDVLVWSRAPANADQIVSRLQRWNAVQELVDSPDVRNVLVGKSVRWHGVVRSVVEVAAFSQSSVLITGESGTGKELIARLIHDLDRRRNKGDLVVVDCTTIVPELSGSEFFGHERGAFTGAMSARDGAFAMANGGTLFLDEIGELSLPLQAQLLRAVQEHSYKRVGGNVWQHTDFRLICATNRNLEAAVVAGQFRADVYYRIAGWLCRTPPLRERKEDILQLAHHFLAQFDSDGSAREFDDPVREYLLTRDYPGNVRDLRRVVASLHHRHAGPGPITIGDVPEEERLAAPATSDGWRDGGFEGAIGHAVELGVGLREIAHAASETAIRKALEREHGNLHRAASRLGVTDRALQLRRANRSLTHGNRGD